MNAQPLPPNHGRGAHAPLRRIDSSAGGELEGPATRVVELVRALARRVEQRPLLAVAAALGAGFVLGGALSFRAGRIALGAAARHVAREVFKQIL